MNDTAHGIVTEPGTLRLERVLPGPIERVWAYLTESGKRGQWLASGEMELREGGSVELVFDHDQISEERYPEDFKKYKGKRHTGRILRIEPPRLLAYTWNEAVGHSEVTFELAARGPDVLLTITHRKLSNREAMVSVMSGWDAHVGILADLLRGEKQRPFWTTHAKLAREYEERIS